MKTVLSQSHQVKKSAPVAGDLGAASRPLQGMAAGRGLHLAKHGQKAGGDRDRVAPARAALGGGEGDRAGFKVDAGKRDAGLFQPAAGVQGDLKAGAHPLRHMRDGQGMADVGDLLLRKDRFSLDRAFSGTEIDHGHGGQMAQQPALAVDPLQQFNVRKGLITAREGSVGAGQAGAPGDVVQGSGRREILQQDPALRHEPGEVAPAVSVVDAGVVGHLVLNQKFIDPRGVRAFFATFRNRKPAGLFHGFGPVQRVVRPVARRLAGPFSLGGFVPEPVPFAVFSFVNRGHIESVANVANWPKTPRN